MEGQTLEMIYTAAICIELEDSPIVCAVSVGSVVIGYILSGYNVYVGVDEDPMCGEPWFSFYKERIDPFWYGESGDSISIAI